MPLKGANRMANSADPYRTAPHVYLQTQQLMISQDVCKDKSLLCFFYGDFNKAVQMHFLICVVRIPRLI